MTDCPRAKASWLHPLRFGLPRAALFRMLAGCLTTLGPLPPGHRAPPNPDPSTPIIDTDKLKSGDRNGAETKLLSVQNQRINDATRE